MTIEDLDALEFDDILECQENHLLLAQGVWREAIQELHLNLEMGQRKRRQRVEAMLKLSLPIILNWETHQILVHMKKVNAVFDISMNEI